MITMQLLVKIRCMHMPLCHTGCRRATRVVGASKFQKVREYALRDEISVNQFIAAPASEKMASFMTLDYLKLEAAKGSHSDFDQFMNLAPNAPIVDGDGLPKN